MADEDIPKDAQSIIKILESMGIEEYEPRVINQLLDFMYRYVSEVLQDAEAFATSSSNKPRGEVDIPEVMQAIQSRALHSFMQPPSQSTLEAVAADVNSRPLPVWKKHFGLNIPRNEEDYLSCPNFNFQPEEMDEDTNA